MMNRKLVNERHVRFCMERGERLHRVVAGNLIDFQHSDGKMCTHTVVKES